MLPVPRSVNSRMEGRNRISQPQTPATPRATRPGAAQSPADLARETIRQLALRKLAPTPDHYSRVYAEISGQPVAEVTPTPAASAVPASPAGQGPAIGGEQWSDVICNLVRRWDLSSPQWTSAQKRESLERLLAASGGNAEKLHTRLASLVKAWGEGSPAAAGGAQAANAASGATPGNPGTAAPLAPAIVAAGAPQDSTLAALRELIIELMRFLGADGDEDPEIVREVAAMADRLRSAATPAELAGEAAALRKLVLKLELSGRGQREVLRGVTGLLHLVVSNMGELVPDERWVKGQIERMRETLSRPLSTATIAEAETALRSVIVKQGTVKKSLEEAQVAMKAMLEEFIARVALMSASAGEYSERIRSANDLAEISGTIKSLLDDTRGAQANAERTYRELETARQRAVEYESRTKKLESELEEISSLAKSDPLTGTLNRRGLQDSTTIEFARAARESSCLALSVLDIDNFKKLNDSLGHAAGDAALQHLSSVLRQTLRPTDIIARLGGEEFVILLPDTDTEEAISVMTRVQRALTRNFFLHGADKVLITFSAGVAIWDGAETEAALIERADAAMYEAKQTGKNRVIAAKTESGAVEPVAA